MTIQKILVFSDDDRWKSFERPKPAKWNLMSSLVITNIANWKCLLYVSVWSFEIERKSPLWSLGLNSADGLFPADG